MQEHAASPGPAGVPGLGAVIARNAAFTVAGRLFFLVGWAAVTPFMLSSLGPDRFAIWALFFALNGYFATFDLGIAQALLKFVAEFSARGDQRSIRGAMTLGALTYAALTLPMVAAFVLLQGPILTAIHVPPALWAEAGFCLVGMAVALAASNLVGVLTAVLNGFQRMDLTNRIQLVVTGLQLGGVIAVLSAGYGLRGLVAVAGVAAVLTGVLSWRELRRVAPETRFDASAIDPAIRRRMFDYSAALQIINFGTFFQFQLDKFLLAHFRGLTEVTPFELAYRLALAAWVVPMLVLPPIVPAVSHLGSLADRERIARLYARASRILAAISVPIGIFTIVSAPAMVTAWLGPGHGAAAVYLSAMAGFLMLTILTGVGTMVCRGLGQPWVEAMYHGLGTVVHLGLSLWLVPRWGGSGVVVALLVSAVISVVWFLGRFHRQIGEPNGAWIREALGFPVLASLVAGAIVLAFTGGLPGIPAGRGAALLEVARNGAVFAVVVTAAYIALKVVTVEELKSLRGRVASARG